MIDEILKCLGLTKPPPRPKFRRMSCVIERKPRRAPRPPRAQSVIAAYPRGVRLVKTKPMPTDELMRLIEKGQRENDPAKLNQLVEQFMEGFYGEKLMPV